MKPLKVEEAAWDLYFAHVFGVMLDKELKGDIRPITREHQVESAALYADTMLMERRKRVEPAMERTTFRDPVES